MTKVGENRGPASSRESFVPDFRFVLFVACELAIAWAAGYLHFHHHYLNLRVWELGPLGPASLPALAHLIYAPLLALGGLDRLTETPGWRVAIVANALLLAWMALWAEHRVLPIVRHSRSAGWLIAALAIGANAAVSARLAGQAVSALFFGLFVYEAYGLIIVALVVSACTRIASIRTGRSEETRTDPAESSVIETSGPSTLTRPTALARGITAALMFVAVAEAVLFFARGIPQATPSRLGAHLLGHGYWTLDGRRVRSREDPGPARATRELYYLRIFLGLPEWLSIAPCARFIAWQESEPRAAVLVCDEFSLTVDTLARGVRAERSELRWQELRNRVVLRPGPTHPGASLRLSATLNAHAAARTEP